MGNKETILCPYSATLFRFDPRLSTGEADPPDSLFATGDEAEAGLAPKERNRLDGEWFDESSLHGVATQIEEGDRTFQ